jgi:penicillin amidase
MPGEDSSYMWQGSIPQAENPHILNPERGFVESANQRAVDSAYPYYIPGDYIIPRGITITRNLSAMEQIVPEDMMALQNSNYNVQAAFFRPVLLKYINEGELDSAEKAFLAMVINWDLNNSAQSKATTIYQSWFDSLLVLCRVRSHRSIRLSAGEPDAKPAS